MNSVAVDQSFTDRSAAKCAAIPTGCAHRALPHVLDWLESMQQRR